MAKEASVAPKERVNIVYKPATGGAQAEVELPLKVMVMGDFTLKPDETQLEERKAINLTKDNFDEVLGQQRLSLDMNVKDQLTGKEGAEMGVSLKFGSMKDFAPGEIAKRVPELKQLLELREALTALKSPLANEQAFRKRIEELLKDPAQRDRVMKELGLGEGSQG